MRERHFWNSCTWSCLHRVTSPHPSSHYALFLFSLIVLSWFFSFDLLLVCILLVQSINQSITHSLTQSKEREFFPRVIRSSQVYLSGFTERDRSSMRCLRSSIPHEQVPQSVQSNHAQSKLSTTWAKRKLQTTINRSININSNSQSRCIFSYQYRWSCWTARSSRPCSCSRSCLGCWHRSSSNRIHLDCHWRQSQRTRQRLARWDGGNQSINQSINQSFANISHNEQN